MSNFILHLTLRRLKLHIRLLSLKEFPPHIIHRSILVRIITFRCCGLDTYLLYHCFFKQPSHVHRKARENNSKYTTYPIALTVNILTLTATRQQENLDCCGMISS